MRDLPLAERFKLTDAAPLLGDLRAMAPALAGLPAGEYRECERAWAAAREFARRELWPRAADSEERATRRPGDIDPAFLRAVCQARLLSASFPAPLGGRSQGLTAAALGMEEMSAACAGLANIIGAHGLGASGVIVSPNRALAARVAGDVVYEEARGRAVLCAAAATEPGAGSDVEDPELLRVARIGCTARRVPGGYRLSGRKVFISNGSLATYVVVVAATDPKRPADTWTSFLVEREMPGFAVGRIEHKMGQRACPAAELVLDDVFVPDRNRLEPGEGGAAHATTLILAASRGPVGAIGTGIARGALERLLHWAFAVSAPGRSLLDQSAFANAVTEIVREITVARASYLAATVAFDHLGVGRLRTSVVGRLMAAPGVRTVLRVPGLLEALSTPAAQERARRGLARLMPPHELAVLLATASLAKVTGSDTAMAVTSRVMRLMGRDALDPRWGVEKCFRDAKLTQIYEGTNQVNRLCAFKEGLRSMVEAAR